MLEPDIIVTERGDYAERFIVIEVKAHAAALLDVEDELRTLRARVAELEARPVATRDVAVIPPQVMETLAEIAARAEAMAAKVEEKV